METQLENKQYRVFENLFSSKTLNIIESYAKLLPDDKSSYTVWPSEATNNNTAPECFTCDILGKDRLEIINELYNNSKLPCYKKSWLKDSNIVVQKLPIGGHIPKHTDYCIFSLTLFLSTPSGGEFVWWDERNNEHIVTPKFNNAVIACYKNFIRGASHEVRRVNDDVRFTLQLFVFDKTKSSTNETKSVIWEIEK